MKKIKNNEQGIAQVFMIIIVIAVVAVIGVAGYLVMKKNKDKDSTATIGSKAAVKCDSNDKDICKFITNWKVNKYYTIKSTDTSDGTTTTSTIEYVAPNRFYIKSSGEPSYEYISIGDVSYTKAGNTWYKQTAKPANQTNPTDSAKYDFKEPTDDATAKTEYKKIGTEACGNLTCLKYQVIDSTNTSTTEYIWFDNKDFQLRRTRSESSDGSVSDQTFTYDKVTINEPSPVKELGPNQYIMPGSTEPMTLPSAQ